MRVKKIKIPIYYGWLVIVISNDFNEVEKEYKLKEKENVENINLYGAFVWKTINENDVEEFMVCVDEEVENHLIAHEVVHLVNLIFLSKGIQLDRHNDEPQAYLTGWVFREIEKFLTEKK